MRSGAAVGCPVCGEWTAGPGITTMTPSGRDGVVPIVEVGAYARKGDDSDRPASAGRDRVRVAVLDDFRAARSLVSRRDIDTQGIVALVLQVQDRKLPASSFSGDLLRQSRRAELHPRLGRQRNGAVRPALAGCGPLRGSA
jgi:hypothetical protein